MVPLRAALGWYLAAAALLLAAAGWWPTLRDALAPPSPARARDALLARALDVVRGAFAASGEFEGRGVSGSGVWSDAEQRGYVTLSRLPRNDPSRERYQLWIHVPAHAHPIDGGVFDASAPEGEVVVPIEATLRVESPTALAITIEKPRGAVVSDRGRLVLTAPLAR